MWRKILAAGILLCGSGALLAAPIAKDGCAELASIVYEEVQATALWGPGKVGPWVISQGSGEIRECRTVAETVSRAFTQAMSSAGYVVSWPRLSSLPLFDDQICDSIFMNECIPDPRGEPVPRNLDIGPVSVFWKAVALTVMRQMHNPYSSNEVRFVADDLRLRLGLALRSSGIQGVAVSPPSSANPSQQ